MSMKDISFYIYLFVSFIVIFLFATIYFRGGGGPSWFGGFHYDYQFDEDGNRQDGGSDGEDIDRMDDYHLYELADRMTSLTGAKNFYELLEVSPTANETVIGTSFRKKSMAWHPDRNQNDPKADAKFAILAAARNILKNEKTRKRYDWILNEAPVWVRGGYYLKKYMTAKLSLSQVMILILFFISIVQFFVEFGRFSIAHYLRSSAKSRLNRMNESETKRLNRKVEKLKEINQYILEQSPELEDWVTANTNIPPFSFRQVYIIGWSMAVINLSRRVLLKK